MGLDKEDIKALISILQKGLVDDDDITETDSSVQKPKRGKSQHKISKTKRSSNTKKHNLNKFMTMPEMHMHKEDLAFDRKVIRHDPVPRRSTYRPLEARCRVCGKTEAVDPAMIESVDRYKCNKCSSSAG